MGEMEFDDMYNYLEPHGNWIDMAPYGYVWTPRNMGYRWRPYNNGHWVSTDYGWTWISHERWGSIPFHYGRWGYDNNFGWYWVPGTTWGPAWVSWRWSNQYVGWAPLPPEAQFQAGIGFSSHSYKTPHRFWVFLQFSHFMHRDINRYSLPYERNITIINYTTIHNNIYFRNNRVINEGVGIDRIQRITGQRVTRHAIRNVNNPGQTRVEGNNVHIYRPTIRKVNTAKPKTFLRSDEARRTLAPVKVFEPRLQRSVSDQQAEVRKIQAQQKSLLKKTQSQELKIIKDKRAKELAQIRDKDERARIAKINRNKIVKLQKQHQVENQKLSKRNEQDLKQVKQVAKQAKQKQQTKNKKK
jgi:hypothetical protein